MTKIYINKLCYVCHKVCKTVALRLASLIVLLLLGIGGSAQTPVYYKATGTGGNTFPFNFASYKNQIMYTPADFQSVPMNGRIVNLYFKNTVAEASGTYTNLKISFLQNNATTFPNKGGILNCPITVE